MKIKHVLREGVKPWVIFSILGMALVFPMRVAGSQPAKLELARNGKAACVIVRAKDCSLSELYATQELSTYLQQMTGAAFPVVDEKKAPGRNRIIVGPCNLSRQLLGKKTIDSLGGEEFIIRTKGNDLLLVGGQPRGTLYAAYHFLDNVLGVRWWDRDATFVPKNPVLAIKVLDLRQKPVFENRQILFHCAFGQDWSARNRINRMEYSTWYFDPNTSTVITLDDKHGGGISYPPNASIHSFYTYLPRDKYFDAHPDWFAEIDGKRSKEGQPCLTNPEVLAFITKQVLEDLRKYPKVDMVSVSQYDGDGNQCRCVNCRKIDEEEGSSSGTLIRFVNAVAEQVEKVRPDVLVETFAYTYTAEPPKITRPRKNVVIRWCNYGGCSYSRPFDAPENAGALQKLQGWGRIANHFYVWDYNGCGGNYFRPFPGLRTMGPNLRIMVQNHANGYLAFGNYTSPGGGFAELQSWVFSRLLWNPNQDDQALIAEFVNGYYGAAGRYIMNYINLIHDAQGAWPLYFGGEPSPSPFVNFEVMNKAEALFQKAESAVAGDPEVLNRVRTAHMPVQCVWAMNRAVWAAEAKAKGLPEPPSATSFLDAFQKQAVVIKVLRGNEGTKIEPFLADLKRLASYPADLFTSIRASGSYASEPYMAFDGDVNTGVNFGGFGPAWIQKDLGKPSKIKSIWTMFGSACIKVEYKIEGSLDEKTWFAIVPRKTIEGEPNVQVEDVLSNPIEARFVRTTIFFGGSPSHPKGEWLGMQEQKIKTVTPD